ncbi:MAG: AAA family ATPase [archaeon]
MVLTNFKDKENKAIKLKVLEAHEDYIGKNIITLDISVKQKLNVVSGDIVEILGNKITYCQVWPEKENTREENTIRMDQYTRRSAQVSIGDFVEVKKVFAKDGLEITLAPLSEIKLLPQNYDLILKKSFLGRPFFQGSNIAVNIFGTNYIFLVETVNPNACVLLTNNTKLIINKKPISKEQLLKPILGYEDVGGLKKEIDAVKEMVELPFKHPQFFKKLNVTPPKGILLYGPPGTGKTLLAKALSFELNANFIAIDAPQIMAKYLGEAENRLRKIFKIASSKTPAIIFIDEIDAIAPKRDSFVSEVEKRVVAQLLSLMDGMGERGDVIVIGATNRIEDLDPALRRPGRFDREIEIAVPNEEKRLDILKIHTRNVPLDKDVNLEEIARITHGYVGADISALIKEAAICSIKKVVKNLDLTNKDIYTKALENLNLSKDDLDFAFKIVQPSALREVFVENSDFDLSSVGALTEQKKIIKDIIELSLKRKEVLTKAGIKPLKKILLYGPSGTGKTMFVKAASKSFGVNFIYIKGPEVISKWLGESEKTIRDIFKKAKLVSPCILFFDEIDSLTLDKRNYEVQTKVLDQILLEMDNILDKDIIFISATNRPDLIDKSFLRSGRIDKIIEFKLPDEKDRKEILELLLSKTPHNKIDLEDIVSKSEGFSGADLNLLITDSFLEIIKENDYKTSKLTNSKILDILKKMRATIPSTQSQIYDNFKSDSFVARYII